MGKATQGALRTVHVPLMQTREIITCCTQAACSVRVITLLVYGFGYLLASSSCQHCSSLTFRHHWSLNLAKSFAHQLNYASSHVSMTSLQCQHEPFFFTFYGESTLTMAIKIHCPWLPHIQFPVCKVIQDCLLSGINGGILEADLTYSLVCYKQLQQKQGYTKVVLSVLLDGSSKEWKPVDLVTLTLLCSQILPPYPVSWVISYPGVSLWCFLSCILNCCIYYQRICGDGLGRQLKWNS